MTELFLEIINMSLSATCLVLAVLLLRFLLKKAPKWINVLLWGLVAFRLVCPFTPESSLSQIPESVSSGHMLSAWTDDYVGRHEIIFDNRAEYQTAVNAGLTPVSAEEGGHYVVTAPDKVSQPATIGSTLIPVLSILWLTGMAAMLVYTLVSYWRLRARVRTAIRVKKDLYLSEYVSSPFVLGLFRPRIYLPYHMDDLDRFHVIAHERAHIRRRDHLWKPLGFLLLTVHWFNPAMWLSYILLCRDIELACDEKVIKELGAHQRADYSQALLHCSVTHRSIAACPLAFGEVGVRERVKNVLSYKKPAFWVILLSMLACAVLAVCFLTDPKLPENGMLTNILTQTGYTIHAQSPTTFTTHIARKDLPDACFTEEGHTFAADDLVLYDQDGSTIFIRRICLDENPNFVRITYEFAYDLPESGTALIPYRVGLPNGQPQTLTNTLSDEQILLEDISSLPGFGSQGSITVTTRTEAAPLRLKEAEEVSLEVGPLSRLHYSAKDIPVSVLNKTYQISEVVYADPRYSSSWSCFDTPYLSVTNDCHILTIQELPITPTREDSGWADRGEAELLTLTEETFDDFFHSFAGAASLRKENQQAWKCSYITEENTNLLYLLRQNNNDLYLACGYSDGDATLLRWLLKLVPCEQTEWAVSLSISDFTRTEAYIEFRQVGAIPEGELSTGSYYALEVWENDSWTAVPSLQEERIFTTEARLISPEHYTWANIRWADDYGELPDGRYRLQTIVTHRHPDGTRTDRSYYAEFLIGGIEDPVFTVEEVSPTGLTLLYSEQTGRDFIIDTNYWLEVKTADGWTVLAPSAETDTAVPIQVTFMGSTDRPQLNWSRCYGELPNGTYRVGGECTFLDATPNIRSVYAEFTIDDWGLDMTITEVSPTAMALEFRSLAPSEDILLQFGNDWSLQKLNYSAWIDVDELDPQREVSPPLETPFPASLLLFHDWTDRYGSLPEGTYRIRKPVTRTLPNGTSETRYFYAEFFLPTENPSIPIRTVPDTGLFGNANYLVPGEEAHRNLTDAENEELTAILRALPPEDFFPAPGITPHTTILLMWDAGSLRLYTDGTTVEFGAPASWAVENEALNTFLSRFSQIHSLPDAAETALRADATQRESARLQALLSLNETHGPAGG